jgi:hypothetical protein
MPIAITVFYSVAFLWLILRLNFFKINGIPQWQIAGFFILKIMAGIGLAWIYTYWYTDRVAADTFKYFDDSEKLFKLFHQDKRLFFQFLFGTAQYSKEYLEFSNTLNTWWNQYTIYNDGRTMVRLNTLLRFISGGYYPVHNIIFCFITFCGLMAICRAFIPWLSRYRKAFVFIMFLFPSLTFWSSGVMKDGIIMVGTGGTLLVLSQFLQNKLSTGKMIALLVLFLTITFFSKLHIFMVMIPCLILFFILVKTKQKPLWSMLLAVMILFLLSVLLKWVYPPADLFAFMAEKQAENIRMAIASKAGSYFEIPVLDGSVLNFLVNIPTGLFNSFLRPLPHEVNSALMLISASENLVMVAATFIILFLSGKKISQQTVFFHFSVLFVLILFTVTGMMTPVSGALVRYKIQGLPYLFFVLMSLLESRGKENSE